MSPVVLALLMIEAGSSLAVLGALCSAPTTMPRKLLPILGSTLAALAIGGEGAIQHWREPGGLALLGGLGVLFGLEAALLTLFVVRRSAERGALGKARA